ncbi:hypothetical protein ABEI56_23245 [Peribacillus castrilensis]|uniref:hypothetical protein n=1 Tax=Peribacillus castrilensis TaxID=2897690 RepID=UPI003D2682DD
MEQWEIEKIERLIANNKKKAEKNLEALIGQTFNELTVLEEAERSKNGQRRLKCQCSCGSIKDYDAHKVKKGHTKSCGCKRTKYIAEARTTHDGRLTLLYSKWSGIKRRCFNPNDSHYPDYGGRGITICDEWKDDFATFQEWSYANGYNDTLSIERMDVNKGYEPSNCKWIPTIYQAWNKQNSVRLIYKGEVQPMALVAQLENIEHKTLSSRYYRFKQRNPQIKEDEIAFEMLQSLTKKFVEIIYKGEVWLMKDVAKAENINHKTLSTRYYTFIKQSPHVDVNSITFDMLIPR